MKAYDKQQIVNQLRGKREDRERILRWLYKDKALKGALMRLLLQNLGSKQDFEFLINQTLIRFYKTCIANKDFELKTNHVTYLLGIARYAWIKELKSRKKNTTEKLEDDHDIAEEYVEIEFMAKEKQEIIADLLGKLGKNCKEVLMFWAHGYSMKEIAERMEYKSPGMAKKKKHICMRELLEFLENNPEHIEDLK